MKTEIGKEVAIVTFIAFLEKHIFPELVISSGQLFRMSSNFINKISNFVYKISKNGFSLIAYYQQSA